MTTTEFSNEFDILYNNVMSNKAPGLEGYEKSVFLTKAQLQVVQNHFNPAGNKYGAGADGNPKRQVELSELIEVAAPTLLSGVTPFDRRGLQYALPTDTLLILNETFSWEKLIGVGELATPIILNVDYQVLPLSFDEYFRLMLKPYKAPLKNQVWRLSKDRGTGGNTATTDIIVEIIPHLSSTEGSNPLYQVRYVRTPNPIILENLADLSVTIQGVTAVTECELNPIVHGEILDRAVELAKSAYLGNLQSTVELNNRNE